MKKLLLTLSAVSCFVLPGCAGSSATEELPPVTPVAKPVAPAAAPTPIPVAAPPEMPSAPKPEKKKKSESTSQEASSSTPVQVNTNQSPSQTVESIISQIRSTNDEEDLRKLESELRILTYEYSNTNSGFMEGSMNALALACEAKRLGHANWETYITAARDIVANIEREKRTANDPVARQQAVDEWKQRFEAERARSGGRRY